jgi:hypothetical protein
MKGLRLIIQDLWSRGLRFMNQDWGAGFTVYGLRIIVHGLGLKVYSHSLQFRVKGSGSRFQWNQCVSLSLLSIASKRFAKLPV